MVELLHMRKRRRLSEPAATVLALFLKEPGVDRFGLDIIRAARIKSGSLYPILHRFEDAGLLRARWEDMETATAAKRRPRRQYRLNDEQAAVAYAMWDEYAANQRAAARVNTTPEMT